MSYPTSIADLDLDSVVLDPAVVRAVRAFAKAKPYQGSIEERMGKFRKLNADLAMACSITAPHLAFDIDERTDSGGSQYIPPLNMIIMRGRLSVITMLHEWGHKLFGPSEKQACQFSLALFKRCFPRSWRRLRFDGHMARAQR